MSAAGHVKQSFFRNGYTFDIERDPATGIVTYEAWSKDGKLDHVDAPAVVLRDAGTRILTFEAWYKNGELHRVDGPAYVERDAVVGAITRQEWWKNGVWTSSPLPIAGALASGAGAVSRS